MQLESKQIRRGTKAEEIPTSPAPPPLFYSHSLLFSKYTTRWRTPGGTLLQEYDGEDEAQV